MKVSPTPLHQHIADVIGSMPVPDRIKFLNDLIKHCEQIVDALIDYQDGRAVGCRRME